MIIKVGGGGVRVAEEREGGNRQRFASFLLPLLPPPPPPPPPISSHLLLQCRHSQSEPPELSMDTSGRMEEAGGLNDRKSPVNSCPTT